MWARSTRSLTLTKGNIVLFIFMFILSTRTPNGLLWNRWLHINTMWAHEYCIVLYIWDLVYTTYGCFNCVKMIKYQWWWYTHFSTFAYFFLIRCSPLPVHLFVINICLYVYICMYICKCYHRQFQYYGKYILYQHLCLVATTDTVTPQ